MDDDDSDNITMRLFFGTIQLRSTYVDLADFRTILEIATRASGCSKEKIFHDAILANDFILTKFLVESGAKIDINKSVECCKYLFGISQGMYDYNINAPPLHIAISIGNIRIVKYLLDWGADKYSTNMNNTTAIDVADACCDVLDAHFNGNVPEDKYIEIAELVRSYEYVPTKGVNE